MKFTAILWAVLTLMVSGAVAQTGITVSSNGVLVKDGHTNDAEIQLDKRDQGWIVAYGKGLVSRAEKVDNITKNATGQRYEMNLQPRTTPHHSKDQKKIAFAAFVDKSDKRDRMAYVVKNGVTMMATAVTAFAESGKAATAMNELLLKEGFAAYDESQSEAVGKVTEFEPVYAIVGEVIDYTVLTRGTPGFKSTVVVRWVVYDYEEKKPLYRFISGSYSNNGKSATEEEVFQQATSGALWGLMTDTGFLEIVNGESSGKDAAGESLSLPYVPLIKNADYSTMVEDAIKSSVTIKTVSGHGSGFVISEDGYVLTNYHVVEDSGKYEVIFNSGLKLRATLVSSNRSRDVALLKINGEGFTALSLDTTAANPRVGTDVIAIGTPQDLKLKQTVTKGIVSGMRELNDHNFIQTDVSINSGNSGGALLNKDGAVIGIVVAKMRGNNLEGLGFAIPIREALAALKIRLK